MRQKKDRNTLEKAWRRVRNRSSRNLRDGGVIIGSSAVTIRLRSFGHQQSLPNLVMENSRGELDLQAEEPAKLEGRIPEDFSLSRPFQGGRVADLDACKQLLQRLLKDSKHGVLFGPRLLVGVPSQLSKLERRTVKEVLKASGARKVELLESALMVVIGAGRDPSRVEGHLVVDLGAGSGEVALVSRGRVQSYGAVPEIGRRMDRAIQACLEEEFQIVISSAAAETLKIEFGSAVEPDTRTTTTVFGRDVRTGLPCESEVDNLSIYRALSPIVEELTEELRQVLKSISSGFTSDIAGDGILMAGGISKLPGLATRLEEFTGIRVEVGERPDLLAQDGLDELLLSPDLRRKLLHSGKAKEFARSGRASTEKMAGALAVALLLVASLFPMNKMDGYQILDSWKATLAPVLSSFQGPDERTIAARFESQIAEKDRRLRLLQKQNEQLAEGGNVSPQQLSWQDQDTLAADVVARPPGSWQQSLVIDQGSNDGVASGMVVTNGDGLVGVVDKIDPESAHVSLLGSQSEPLGGKIARTSSHGVILPGPGRQMTMTYLDPAEGIRLGDVVTTSGLNGTFPPGVPVGTVTGLNQPQGKSFLEAKIEPAAELDSLDSVLMLSTKKTHRI